MDGCLHGWMDEWMDDFQTSTGVLVAGVSRCIYSMPSISLGLGDIWVKKKLYPHGAYILAIDHLTKEILPGQCLPIPGTTVNTFK